MTDVAVQNRRAEDDDDPAIAHGAADVSIKLDDSIGDNVAVRNEVVELRRQHRRRLLVNAVRQTQLVAVWL